MKVKTLKEIFWLERLKMCGCGSCSEGLSCDIKIIKQEAIKDIKFLADWYLKSNEEHIEYLKLMFGKDYEDELDLSFTLF